MLTAAQWSRVMFSRLTIFYFAFSLIHFAIQLGLQIRAFTTNADASAFLGDLVARGEATTDWLPILRNDNISVCNWVSSNLDTDVETCKLVWAAREESENNQSQNPPSGLNLDLPISDSSTDSTAATSSSPVSTSAVPSSTVATSTTSLRRSTTTVFVAATPTSLSDDDDNDDDEEEGDDDEDEDEDEAYYGKRDLETTRVEKDGKVAVLVSGIEGQEPFTLEETCLEALNWPLSM